MSDIAIYLKNAAGFGRKIEKAWLVVVAIFIGLAIFVPLQAEASFAFVAEALTGMAPFLAWPSALLRTRGLVGRTTSSRRRSKAGCPS